MENKQVRKIEQIALRIEGSLLTFEMILLPLILVGAVLVYTGKVALGIPIGFGAAMILTMIYFFRWFYPELATPLHGFMFKLLSFTLAIGTLGAVFTLFHMANGKLFIVIALADVLVSAGFWLFFRNKVTSNQLIAKGDAIRLLLVFVICAVLLMVELPVPEAFLQPIVIE
jgi:hypothetical protein